MIEYIIAKCPYDNHHWRVRNVTVEEFRQDGDSTIGLPKSCPKCKQRFDQPWSKKPTFWIEEHANPKELRKALAKYLSSHHDK